MKSTSLLIGALLSVLITACSPGLKLSQEELERKNYQEVYGLLDVSAEQEKPENMPKYPRGNGGLIEDIQGKLNYPQAAREQEIEGNVIVGFTVDKKGALQQIEVEKSVHPALDTAAVNVLGRLQPWYPAFTEDEPVSVRLKTLITFRLQSNGNSTITQ